MQILLPSAWIKSMLRTGRAPYERKTGSSHLDFERLRRAEAKRRRRAEARLEA